MFRKIRNKRWTLKEISLSLVIVLTFIVFFSNAILRFKQRDSNSHSLIDVDRNLHANLSKNRDKHAAIRVNHTVDNSNLMRHDVIEKSMQGFSDMLLRALKSDHVFYNRIPRCGSEGAILMMRSIGKQNGFKVHRSHDMQSVHLNVTQQVSDKYARQQYTCDNKG